MERDRHLLTDIRLTLADGRLRPVYRADEAARRLGDRRLDDLATVAGRDNLGQAIVLRLLTPRGELAGLGHPEYGSRLHELIGTPNNATRHSLVKLHILESLAREPRVAGVARVTVAPAAGRRDTVRRDTVRVDLTVVPTGATDTVTIGPFTLEL